MFSLVELVPSNENKVSCSRTQYYDNSGTSICDLFVVSLALKEYFEKVNDLIKSEENKQKASEISQHAVFNPTEP